MLQTQYVLLWKIQSIVHSYHRQEWDESDYLSRYQQCCKVPKAIPNFFILKVWKDGRNAAKAVYFAIQVGIYVNVSISIWVISNTQFSILQNERFKPVTCFQKTVGINILTSVLLKVLLHLEFGYTSFHCSLKRIAICRQLIELIIVQLPRIGVTEDKLSFRVFHYMRPRLN